MLRTKLLSSVSILVVLAMSLPAAGDYSQTFKIDADDAHKDALYGSVTAVDGNIAIVGSQGFSIGYGSFNTSSTGKAYLVDVTTGGQIAELINPNDGRPQDYFGGSVDIDGNYAIIGAPKTGDWTGAAYLYNISNPAKPLFIKSLTNPGAGNAFGVDVAVSGTTAIVGSRNDGNAFVYNASTGAYLSTLTPAAAGADFGNKVAIDGHLAAVYDGDKPSGDVGLVTLFDLTNPASPVRGAAFNNGTGFGFSLDISGNMLAVGSIKTNGERGTAFLYNISDINNPVQIAELVQPDGGVAGEHFGFSVGIDGSRVVVGRRDAKAFVYDVAGNYLQTLTASDGGAGFGAQGVSIDGRIVVGAWNADGFNNGEPVTECGAVYVFANPEPSTFVLVCMGAAGLLGFVWRRRRKHKYPVAV